MGAIHWSAAGGHWGCLRESFSSRDVYHYFMQYGSLRPVLQDERNCLREPAVPYEYGGLRLQLRRGSYRSPW
jgi:hypothetical protein